MDRRQFLIGAPLALAGCGAQSVWAPADFVQRVAYTHPGPKNITLFTMKNTGTDNGAHTGLMVSASQRVIFDPAGTFGHESIPERNDVHYGITPRIEEFYITYHSRVSYYTMIQSLDVSPEVAEMALRAVEAAGPVPKALCTTRTSSGPVVPARVRKHPHHVVPRQPDGTIRPPARRGDHGIPGKRR